LIWYREVGDGPAILFVHGVLANGTLWREVVPRLSGHFGASYPTFL
jgi:pimeloyl-ACP methyl ester carboxylesterase